MSLERKPCREKTILRWNAVSLCMKKKTKFLKSVKNEVCVLDPWRNICRPT